MKRAFTLIELMICLAIVAIIACIAIPNIMEHSIVGKDRMWQGQRVRVLALDAKTIPQTYIIRTSNGEVHVNRDELSEVPMQVEAQ